LPSIDDTYGELENNYIWRTLYFIDSDREKKIGIGEDYPVGKIPHGECRTRDGHLFNDEIVIFGFKYDYYNLVK